MRGRLVCMAIVLGLCGCAKILGIRPPERGPFEHRAHVIRGISCLRCHAGAVAATDDGPLHLPSDQDCRGCHRTPHDDGSCQGCHGLAESRDGAAIARRQLRFEHRTHVPRVRGNCVRCHVDVATGDEGLRPAMATCFGCHAHRDQFATRDCSACHVDLPSEGVTPETHLVHEGDFVDRHGVQAAAARDLCATCHSEAHCAACHGLTAPVTAARQRFDDVLGSGLHRAGFRSRHAEEARADPGLCTTCHAAEACADCHDREGLTAPRAGSASIHPTGWLGLPGESNDHGRAARRDPLACASCHGGAGEALCIGCHRVGGVGGNPHPPGWSRRTRTATDPACRPCHEVIR